MAGNRMVSINRIWLGGSMPEEFRQYGQEWLDLNPEYSLHDWTEEEILDTQWINQDVLNQMHRESRQPGADMVAYYTHVADVVDYEITYRGGWYFNCDLKPLKPLSSLSPENIEVGLAYEDDVHLVNMAMYAKESNAFMAKIIELLPKRYFGMPGAFMNASTGCQLIMQARSQYTGRVTGWPRNIFNPIHFSDFGYGDTPNIQQDFPKETVAVHLWGHRTNQRGQRILEP